MPAKKPAETPFQPNLYVVARFLDALHDGPRARAPLQAAVGVNYDILRRYLAFLEGKRYVAQDEDGTVRLTAEGRRVRAELRAWIDRFLDPDADAARGQTLKDGGPSPASP